MQGSRREPLEPEGSFESLVKPYPSAPSLHSVSISSTSSTSLRPKKTRRKTPLTVNLSGCKYDILHTVCKQMGYKVVDDTQDWHVTWLDTGVSPERILAMGPHQRINHFPGMHEICRKDFLARNMARIKKHVPGDYRFFPRSFVLPHDLPAFEALCKKRRKGWWIAKPGHGCQGKGIFLFPSSSPPTGEVIVQEYLSRPMLMDGFKFDLRIYVLVSSVDPLRIHVHKEGLARFATTPYATPSSANAESLTMHLTNYAINKNSEAFDRNEAYDRGSKRTLSSVMARLAEKGMDTHSLWSRIQSCIVKTILIVQPQLARTLTAFRNSTSNCFEVLGFDILLDKKGKPWVLEVNHSPSWTCDAPIDTAVKTAVLLDTFKLLHLTPKPDKDKKQRKKPEGEQNPYDPAHLALLAAQEDPRRGGYDRAFPPSSEGRLNGYLHLMREAEAVFVSRVVTNRRRQVLDKQKALEQERQEKYEAWKRKRFSVLERKGDKSKQSGSFPSLQYLRRLTEFPFDQSRGEAESDAEDVLVDQDEEDGPVPFIDRGESESPSFEDTYSIQAQPSPVPSLSHLLPPSPLAASPVPHPVLRPLEHPMRRPLDFPQTMREPPGYLEALAKHMPTLVHPPLRPFSCRVRPMSSSLSKKSSEIKAPPPPLDMDFFIGVRGVSVAQGEDKAPEPPRPASASQTLDLLFPAALKPLPPPLQAPAPPAPLPLPRPRKNRRPGMELRGTGLVSPHYRF